MTLRLEHQSAVPTGRMHTTVVVIGAEVTLENLPIVLQRPDMQLFDIGLADFASLPDEAAMTDTRQNKG